MKTVPIGFAAVLACATASGAAAQTTTRWTCSPAEEDFASSIGGDGRYIAYQSNSWMDVFPFYERYELRLLDTTNGTWQPVALHDFGGAGYIEFRPSVTTAGEVLFADVTAYDPNDGNGFADVYVFSPATGARSPVSVTPSGVTGNNASLLPGSISSDGRFAAFTTYATNLVPVDTNGRRRVVVRDRMTATTELVSVDSGGAQADDHCHMPAVSADGRFVAFTSRASNLVPGDTEGRVDVFLRDRVNGTTRRLSVAPNGAGANADTPTNWAPAISADGRFVAFESTATNLVANDTNATVDVFVRDTVADVTFRASLGPNGVEANAPSYLPAISADGRYVSFQSAASNLVSGDVNGGSDIFVRDRTWNVTEIASVTTSGQQGTENSGGASLSADGRFLSFSTSAPNLGGNCVPTEWGDIARRDRGADPFTTYCRGDGSAGPCPCGNEVPAGANSGCLHSAGLGGTLAAIGNPSIAYDTLALRGTGMPDAPALYFQGTTEIAQPFGDGLRCAGGTVVRIATRTNVAGASEYPPQGGTLVHVAGNVTQPGTRTYQVWFRNAAAFCTPDTYNLTNGLRVAWRP